MKVILITGCSRGLGYQLAEKLSSGPNIVYAGMRNPTPFDPKIPNYRPITLDLTQENSLKTAVERIIKETNTIDVVIHNAGIAYIGPVESIKLEEAKELFEVNVFGALRLTQLILPHMRQKKKGQILFISSTRAVESHAFLGLYSATKSALEAIAFDLAVTLMQWNINVSVIRPGPISTGMPIQQGSYFQPETNPYPQIPPIDLKWQSPEEVCEIITNILNQEHPLFCYQTSSHAEEVASKYLKDPAGQKWLEEQKAWVSQSDFNSL